MDRPPEPNAWSAWRDELAGTAPGTLATLVVADHEERRLCVSDRQMRLFFCALARRFWGQMPEAAAWAVRAGEAFADRPTTASGRRACNRKADAVLPLIQNRRGNRGALRAWEDGHLWLAWWAAHATGWPWTWDGDHSLYDSLHAYHSVTRRTGRAGVPRLASRLPGAPPAPSRPAKGRERPHKS